MTYTNITEFNLPPKMTMYNIPKITKEEVLKIYIGVAHAQVKNQERQGSYAVELNKVVRENNLPNITIPDESPEQPLTGAVSLDSTQQVTPVQQQSLSRQSSLSNISVSSEPASTKKLDSKDLGLKFFTTKAIGWPHNFSTEELIQEVRSKKLKWTYTNKKYNEEQILRKTEKGEINLSGCSFSVETDEFRKIRPGLIQEHSPMEQRDPRLRKTTNN